MIPSSYLGELNVLKGEVVRLLSRGIAILQFIAALDLATYLPERLMALHHYRESANSDYLPRLYSLEVGMLLFRIVGLLILAWVFWQCGPKLSQLIAGGSGDEPPKQIARIRASATTESGSPEAPERLERILREPL